MTSPLISVLIPVYNGEKYLRESLDSVIAQTYTNLEILCMDDGSTDKSAEILEEYALKDNRIKVFHQPNSGVAVARNALLDSAGGDFIAFLDAYDTLSQRALEAALYFIQKENADIAEFATGRTDVSGIKDYAVDYQKSETRVITDMNIFLKKDRKQSSWITIWNKLYRAESIKGIYFDEKLSYEEDYWFSLLVTDKIEKKVIIPLTLHYYRVNDTSVTGKINFEKYVSSATHRIRLSYDHFLKGGKVPLEYIVPFKRDLVIDAYRMMIQKNLKKNPNKWQRKRLFLIAADAFAQYVQKRVIDIRYLPFHHRIVAFLAARKHYFICRMLCRL